MSSARRALALVASSLFAVAFAAFFAAQLSLMSLLDTTRAERAAAEVAESELVGALVDDAVRNALAPLAGPAVAADVAALAADDPRVRSVIRSSLVTAHRQVVDPDARTTATGAPVEPDAPIDAAVLDVVAEIAAERGVDLGDPSELAGRLDAPTAVPERLPAVGLRDLAGLTRWIAVAVAVVAGLTAVALHPRPALGLAGLGARAAIVCGGWALGLLVVGWVIARTTGTLYGELLDGVWGEVAPTLLLLASGGALVAVGVWLGGRSLEGFWRAATVGARRP